MDSWGSDALQQSAGGGCLALHMWMASSSAIGMSSGGATGPLEQPVAGTARRPLAQRRPRRGPDKPTCLAQRPEIVDAERRYLLGSERVRVWDRGPR